MNEDELFHELFHVPLKIFRIYHAGDYERENLVLIAGEECYLSDYVLFLLANAYVYIPVGEKITRKSGWLPASIITYCIGIWMPLYGLSAIMKWRSSKWATAIRNVLILRGSKIVWGGGFVIAPKWRIDLSDRWEGNLCSSTVIIRCAWVRHTLFRIHLLAVEVFNSGISPDKLCLSVILMFLGETSLAIICKIFRFGWILEKQDR